MSKKRMVVKVGTSTLTHPSGSLDLRSMEHLVRVLSERAALSLADGRENRNDCHS